MKTTIDILKEKQNQVFLDRTDLIEELEDPSWRKKHPIGPIHVQLKCKLCSIILFEDLKEFGWLHNDSFWLEKIVPHFKEKH